MERFCQNRSLYRAGTENLVQSADVPPLVPWPDGQVMALTPLLLALVPAIRPMFANSTALFCTLTRPAGCGQECVPVVVVQVAAGSVLARGANRDWSSTPEEAVATLDTTVWLTMSVASASSREIPPPSYPATLLAMMLLVTRTAFHGVDAWCGGCVCVPTFGHLTVPV